MQRLAWDVAGGGGNAFLKYSRTFSQMATNGAKFSSCAARYRCRCRCHCRFRCLSGAVKCKIQMPRRPSSLSHSFMAFGITFLAYLLQSKHVTSMRVCLRVPLVPWSCAGYGKLTCHPRYAAIAKKKQGKKNFTAGASAGQQRQKYGHDHFPGDTLCGHTYAIASAYFLVYILINFSHI